jgi:hypothetical protein
MPRDPNLPTVAFGWYYFSRGTTGNRKIITNETERDAFRDLLTATLAAHEAHLHFVFVDENGMHLGARAGCDSLTKALGSFCGKFSHQINRWRNEKGSLFRPHAHVVLIQPGKWFLLLGRFIHWIPRLNGDGLNADAGLQINSDAQYRSRKRIRGLDTSLVLRIVSHGSRQPGVQDEAYRALFDQAPSETEIALFRRGSPQDSRIVGDPTFISRTAREIGVPLHPRARKPPGAIEEIPGHIESMLECFRRVCNQCLPPTTTEKWTRVATLENICSKSRQPPLPMLRALAAAHLVDSGRFRLEQLETVFQCRPRTLSAGRRRAYQLKFEALFGRPCQELMLEPGNGSILAMKGPGNGTTEPITNRVGNASGVTIANFGIVHIPSLTPYDDI